MSPLTPYLIYLKLGAAAVLLALAAGAGFHLGGLKGHADAADAKTALQADRAAQSELTAKAVLAERASAEATAAQDHITETQHAQTIIQIDSAPVNRTPVFVCSAPGPVRIGPMPGAEAQASGQPADTQAGRSDQGRGVNIRAALDALEIKYEKVLADYRQIDAEWPK